jgi:hypothetical protein
MNLDARNENNRPLLIHLGYSSLPRSDGCVLKTLVVVG